MDSFKCYHSKYHRVETYLGNLMDIVPIKNLCDVFHLVQS